jgi:virginiamycin B lyase
MWFTEHGGSKIGRISMAGDITEYPLPTAGSNPDWITTGPDGALWFTSLRQIGRITTTGAITGFSTRVGEFLNAITAGPHGLWFTGAEPSQIGHAPACGLGLSASFVNRTLSMNFDLGIDRPATWSVSAANKFGLERPVPAVVPPRAFTLKWGPYPESGDVLVESKLSDQLGEVLCEEWTTVDTAQ